MDTRRYCFLITAELRLIGTPSVCLLYMQCTIFVTTPAIRALEPDPLQLTAQRE